MESSRVHADAEVERQGISELQDHIGKWKHQAMSLEKNKVLLLTERNELKKEISLADDKVKQIKVTKFLHCNSENFPHEKSCGNIRLKCLGFRKP